jgi:hypothetical protein
MGIQLKVRGRCGVIAGCNPEMNLHHSRINGDDSGPAAWASDTEADDPADVLSYVAYQGFELGSACWDSEHTRNGSEFDVRLTVFTTVGLSDEEQTREEAVYRSIGRYPCPPSAARHYVNTIDWILVNAKASREFLAAKIKCEIERLAGRPQSQLINDGGSECSFDEEGNLVLKRPWIFFMWPLNAFGLVRESGVAFLSTSAFGYSSVISDPCKIRKQATVEQRRTRLTS